MRDWALKIRCRLAAEKRGGGKADEGVWLQGELRKVGFPVTFLIGNYYR